MTKKLEILDLRRGIVLSLLQNLNKGFDQLCSNMTFSGMLQRFPDRKLKGSLFCTMFAYLDETFFIY